MDDQARRALIGHEAEGVKIDEAPEHEKDCVALLIWLDSLMIAMEDSLAIGYPLMADLNDEVVGKLRQIRCLARQGINCRFDADYYSGRWMG